MGFFKSKVHFSGTFVLDLLRESLAIYALKP